MNHGRAHTLLTQTFDQPFNETHFTTFTRDLLNRVDTSQRGRTAMRSGNYIPQAFRGHISRYHRLGIYTDPHGQRLDILIIKLSHATALDRARTMQRNFISHYITKLDHAQPVEAVLAAYFHDDVADWRFSFVQLEYLYGDEGLEERLTPARRYSYLVGPTEPTHTAEQQLLPLLLDDRTNPTIAQIAHAFHIESVNRQFFDAYKELFLRLTEAIAEVQRQDEQVRREFERIQLDMPNFAKKLLGQIVFLYFVQKKGWLGVADGQPWGSGPKNFLRRLFEQENGVTYTNFFDDLLEPLFYDALAIDRSDRNDQFDPLNCRIPFLNGGLFEPMQGYDWRRTHLTLPNALFSNRRDERDDSGTGILDVFDRYNFTVREEEPLEKEVAVDPEMLGKVFENLLEVSDRKSKGAFYTPREIVHYMCQESLINYLDTALNIRTQALDADRPRQGSLLPPTQPQQSNLTLTETKRVERVPRADLATLVRQGALALQQDAAKEAGLQKDNYVLPQTVRHHAADLDTALANIKVCDPAIGSGAFPVGMLHEIVQARQALATYLPDHAPAHRSPYALKRRAIQDSIYGVDLDAGAVEIAKLRLWLSLVVDEESYDNINPLPNLDYKIVQGNSLLGVQQESVDLFNNSLYVKLQSLKQTYFDATHRDTKQQLRAQINLLLEQLTGSADTFDFEIFFQEVFAERGGFDVVIGNPPYVRHELIKAFKPQFKNRYPAVYAGTADLYVYFYEQGVRLLHPQGTLAYITSNKFMRAGYGKNLRVFLGDRTTLHALIDFGDLPVFEATAYPVILLTRRQEPTSAAQNLTALTVETLDILRRLPQKIDELAWPMPQNSLRKEGWALVRPDVLALMRKLRRTGQPLEKYVDGRFYRGILTGFNEAFVIDGATRAQLIAEDPKSAEVIKPWLRGRDIKRWRVDWQGLYVIFTRRGIDIEQYPAIKQHLAQFKEQLMPKPKDWRGGTWPGRKAGPYEWYEIQDVIAYYEEFDKPKILYQEIATFQSFAYVSEPFFVNNKCFLIPDSSLFLLAILNSPVVWFFLLHTVSQLRGGAYAMQTPYVSQIPIPPATAEQQATLEALINELLTQPSPARVAQLEAALNQQVYALYNLTPEEINLIETQVGG